MKKVFLLAISLFGLSGCAVVTTDPNDPYYDYGIYPSLISTVPVVYYGGGGGYHHDRHYVSHHNKQRHRVSHHNRQRAHVSPRSGGRVGNIGGRSGGRGGRR